MTEWRTIETAPKDGTVVDVWALNRKTGRGWRVPGAEFGSRAYPYWKDSDGKWFTGKRYYETYEEDELYDPGCEDEESVVVTHWMPLPPPPETSK